MALGRGRLLPNEARRARTPSGVDACEVRDAALLAVLELSVGVLK